MPDCSSPLECYDAVVAVWKSGRSDEAIAQMRELNQTHPEEPLPCAALAAWYKKTDKIDDAIHYAERYCELVPDDPFGFSILSSLRLSVGLREAAEDALMKASDLRIAAQLNRKKDEDG